MIHNSLLEVGDSSPFYGQGLLNLFVRTRRELFIIVAISAIGVTKIRSADVVITSFENDGTLCWSVTQGAEFESFSIEWASSIDGEWHSDWSPLQDIANTGGQYCASTPRFFRVVGVTSDYRPAGQVLKLDTQAASMTVPHSNSLSTTNGLTLAVWFKPGVQENPFPRLIAKVDGYSGYELALASRNGYSQPAWFRYSTTNAFQDVGVNSWRFDTDKWYHAVGTWDGTMLRYYVNGRSLDETVSSAPIINNTKDLVVGQNGGQFVGEVDDVCIWDRGLSIAQVTTLYRSGITGSLTNGLVGWWKMDGDCQDSSGNGNHGFLNDTATFVPANP